MVTRPLLAVARALPMHFGAFTGCGRAGTACAQRNSNDPYLLIRLNPRNAMKFIFPTLIAAVALTAGCEKPAPAAPPPPTEVMVAPVTQKDVPVYLELVGQTVGYQDVEIRARVEGILEAMNFQEGSFVTRGQPLYRIDRKPLEATLAAARAVEAMIQRLKSLEHNA